MKKWFKNPQNIIVQTAKSRWGIWILFLCAFADASFLPLPSTTFFLFLIAFNTEKASEYIFSVTLGISSGALLAYFAGNFVWLGPDGEHTAFCKFLFNHFPWFSEDAYIKINTLYTKWNFWILGAVALTPIPYGIFAAFSGVSEINIFIFLLTTILSHTIKFSFLALATLNAGELIRKLSVIKWKPHVMITSFFIGIAVFISNTFKNLFQ